jgi:hypothetical protein
MTLIQLIVVLIILKALFLDKIYSHKFFGLMDILTELCILSYLKIGNINTWMGEGKIDKSTWTNIQLF